jgi:hypothetical protein
MRVNASLALRSDVKVNAANEQLVQLQWLQQRMVEGSAPACDLGHADVAGHGDELGCLVPSARRMPRPR